MSIQITTVLTVNGGEYTLPLPQKQNDFDKYLTQAGILTGASNRCAIVTKMSSETLPTRLWV